MKFFKRFSNPDAMSLDGVSPAPPSKLRTRIMASGYKYSLLEDKSHLKLVSAPTGRFHKLSKWSRVILAILIPTVLLALLLLVVGLVLRLDGKEASKSSDDELRKDVAMALLSNMNQSADPCSNLYEFSCGGWLQKHSEIPGDRPSINRFYYLSLQTTERVRKLLETKGDNLGGHKSTAVEKVKLLYNTCMDVDTLNRLGTSRVKKWIEQLGSWTVAPTEARGWDQRSWTLKKILSEPSTALVNAIFQLDISEDLKNTSRYIMYFSQPGLTLPSETLYWGPQADTFKQAYLNYATKVAVLLGGEENDAKRKMSDVYQFEHELAKIFVPQEEMVDPSETYHKMSLSQFQRLVGSQIDVVGHIKALSQGIATIRSKDKVVVPSLAYFQRVKAVLQNTSNEVVANFMMWQFVQSVVRVLPDEFSTAALELNQLTLGITELSSRWKRCVTISERVGFASGALYVEKDFPPESKNRTVRVMRAIQKAFLSNLETIDWLDDRTRTHLKEKAEAVVLNVGYPDWILNATKLDEYYANLTVQSGELLENFMASGIFQLEKAFQRYTKIPDREEWFVQPQTVNAFYSPSSNKINVPAGILQPPFFAPEYPDAVLYGTLGMVVGHELTHGFDNRGRYFDKKGSMVDSLWTQQAAKAFKERSQCMVEQYSNYSVDGMQLNGELTLSENIADCGGLKLGQIAFENFGTRGAHLPGMEGYTDQQIRFIAFAQLWCAKSKPEFTASMIRTNVHTIAKYRVIGVSQNSAFFAEAFHCDKDKYNQETRCSVW